VDFARVNEANKLYNRYGNSFIISSFGSIVNGAYSGYTQHRGVLEFGVLLGC